METIYLDYNATTPLDPVVIAEMRPFMEEVFGNPSSIHEYGTRAKKAVELARQRLAGLLNCFPDEIIFTSGGTESNNFAIKGAAFAKASSGNHIITTAIEHPAVLEVCRYLEGKGFRVTYVGVDDTGLVDPGEVERAICSETILITVMHSNNEVGTIQPIQTIGKIAFRHGILFHSDAAQSVGKIPVDVKEAGVDLLSVAGHKLYAPKGIGALFIRRGVTLEKLIHGANHERNLRAGTENVLEIVGLGKAAEIASQGMEAFGKQAREVRDRLHKGIMDAVPAAILNGHPEKRLPNTLSISFPGIDAGTLLERMRGIAASAGAACHSDRVDVSSVLEAMKIPVYRAMGTIRFSVGRMTTVEETDRAVGIIASAYNTLAPEGGTEWGSLSAMRGADVKLTEYTHSLGCACKIRPQLLEQILKTLPAITDPSVIIGPETSDDAAAYRITDSMALLQTLDFIPPIVDDPYAYGAIAAANSLSDIYAMGGEPLFALSMVAFPDRVLPGQVLREILRGATDKTTEAGIFIVGGHSIEDNEPKFGLVVTGKADPLRILRNRGGRPGDLLILTKPIGSGIITTAMKRGYAGPEARDEAIRVMSGLNRSASAVLMKHGVHACTDVTGFGLLGHLKEMVRDSETDAHLEWAKIPLLRGVLDYASAGMIPGGTMNNLAFVRDIISAESSIPELAMVILADAQTSGGLLAALPVKKAETVVSELAAITGQAAAIIGTLHEGQGRIRIR